jgi:superoxide dismutase, Cu-Zn family
MTTRTMLIAGTAIAVLAGCGRTMRAVPGGETITIRDAPGRTVGTALLMPTAEGVHVVMQVSGLEPGPHGVHIHRDGRCEGPDFESSGPHFNPHGREHGFQNPRGFHAGDLPNLEVGADGNGLLNAVAVGVTLEPGRQNSLRGPGGTSLVIHASADDYRTDPAGGSGERIACGVIPEAR